MSRVPLRILVVDDSTDSTRMLAVLLKREGYETRTAFDGPSAIEAATLHRPDVVLLDLTLTGLSGVEVATELRCITALSSCILVAVSGSGEERLPCPSPFDHHFMKPVNHVDLLEYLSRCNARSTPPPFPATAVA
jgi:CheY-like chemotaxis protein